MPERFTPRSATKERGRQEIEEGLEEYLTAPRSKEGLHSELALSFETEKSEKPLKRDDIEKEVEAFVNKHFDQLLPTMLSSGKSHDELIKQFKITNEDIGLLGAQYYIREEDGQAKIFKTDEYYPDGYQVTDQEITVEDFLALAHAKASLRVDTLSASGKIGKGKSGGGFSHRYYLRTQDRYLCSNDYGMGRWSDEEKKFEAGDVTNGNNFLQTIKKQLERIQINVGVVANSYFEKHKEGLMRERERERERVNQPPDEQLSPAYLTYEEQQEIDRKAWEKTAAEVGELLNAHPFDKELVLTAIPGRKIRNQLHFNYEKIARKYGFMSDDAALDYEQFADKASNLEQLLREPPAEQKAKAAVVPFVYSDFYRKPVIPDTYFDTGKLIKEAQGGVRETLAKRAADNDPELKDAFYKYQCKRGTGSPYFYPDYQVYDFLKAVGAEKAGQVLEADDRNVSEQMKAWKELQALGYDVGQFEPDKLKKQLHECRKIDQAQVWEYLKKREGGALEKIKAKQGDKVDIDENWLEAVGTRRARALFREAKRMYWLAQQVYMQAPGRQPEDRFYREASRVDWSCYDLTKADVTEEKLTEYLEKHRNLIVALLSQGQEGYYSGDEKDRGTPATLGLIVQALERGQDLRGVALAHDKQRYLEGVINGTEKNDIDFAIMDWPTAWRSAVSQEELELYYEYANDYVVLDPQGLTKYAAWRASAEGKEWVDVFKEDPKKKAELDFRICLAGQTPEVRGWYKQAAEYVGNSVVQSYVLRFNVTRGGDGRLANLHDVLYWVPNLRNLEAGDAKSVLGSIETMDENQEFIQLLPRYSKHQDPLRNAGSIQSLRELKKRILAIESNIDLASLPPELLDITSAPGFNLSALESMRHSARFKDLLEGRLDEEQPFKPHSRLFAGRALTESLREGLGSQKQKIRGTAQDPKGLFHALNKLIKDRMIGEKKMQVVDLFESVPIDLEEEIIKLLQAQKVDLGPTVEAQLHAKSDPEAWVCGNYTDCCMPFGDPKNDDYMYNPSTQYFTIKYNGRIVAQSVVADGRDHRDNKDVVILDNIEVANNYKNLTPLLAKVYQTFWTEYTNRPVKVGTGYSDLIPPGGKLEQNNYSPKTRLYYSDATGHQIYDMPKIRGLESLDEILTFANLTERDTELIAKMEEQIYPEGMVQGKHHIVEILQKQRELEVPGAASSFVARQGQEAAGYLLVLPEESKTNPEERAAHVYDMAVLPKFRGTPIARKMMERVLEVASAYQVPIEAEARVSTSYALLMNKRVRRWFESKGFYLTTNEKMEEYMGGEDFYFVRFENRQGRELENEEV